MTQETLERFQSGDLDLEQAAEAIATQSPEVATLLRRVNSFGSDWSGVINISALVIGVIALLLSVHLMRDDLPANSGEPDPSQEVREIESRLEELIDELSAEVDRMSEVDAGGEPTSIAKVGRNERCPCGSGKKYKHCHGSSEANFS